jgi:hypothetical protein
MHEGDSDQTAAERRKNRAARLVFDDLCADLKVRLRNVCNSMAPGELDRLVAAMNRLRLRYETESSVPRPWSSSHG